MTEVAQGDAGYIVESLPFGDASEGGTLHVLIEDEDDEEDPGDLVRDYTSPPSVGLGIEYRTPAGTHISIDYIELNETTYPTLIRALTEAWNMEKARATARGYYAWLAAGQPDALHDPDNEFFNEDS